MKRRQHLMLVGWLVVLSGIAAAQYAPQPIPRSKWPIDDAHLVSSAVTCIAWSEDGDTIAIGLWNYRVHIKNLQSPQIRTMIDVKVEPRIVSFLAPGAIAVVGPDTEDIEGEKNAVLETWDVKSGSRLRRRDLAFRADSPLGMSPDGTRLAAVSAVGEVHLVDLRNGDTTSSFRTPVPAECVALGSDSVAVGYGDGTVEVFDGMTQKSRWRVCFAPSAVDSLHFAPSGATLVVNASSAERSILVLRVASGEKVSGFSCDNPVQMATVSDFGSFLAWVDKGPFLRIENARTGQNASTIPLMLEGYFTVAMNSQGTRVAVGSGYKSEMGEIQVWSVKTRKLEYSAYSVKLSGQKSQR